jgi:hypothetical protein
MTEELPFKQQTNRSVLSGYVDGSSCNLFVARKLLCYEPVDGFSCNLFVARKLLCYEPRWVSMMISLLQHILIVPTTFLMHLCSFFSLAEDRQVHA